MAIYPFDTQLVFAADNPGMIMTNASVTLYNPTDTALITKLTLTDPNGLPLANPVAVSPAGFMPAFRASIPQVRWVSGAYSGYLNSYQGLLDLALAAQQAAQASALAAGAVLPTGATDGQYLSIQSGVPFWKTLTSSGGTGGSGRVDYAIQTGSTLPPRPTPDPTIVVMWIGWTEPARITSGTGGAMPNDIWIRRDAP